jgi:hypothetical protein
MQGFTIATEFTLMLPDEPGRLARLGQTLGEAGVNIEAIQGMTVGGHGLVRFVAASPGLARDALEKAGVPYMTREVLVVRVLDEPGVLGEMAFVMAKAGININAVYVTTRGHVVLSVDDLAGAIHVASGMAVMIDD